jgi:hypothetical protein
LKVSKDGKTTNITIRTTENLKEKAEAVWAEKYNHLPFNTFLGHMVSLGIEEEGVRIEENKAARAARIEAASKAPDKMPDVTEIEIMKRQIERLTEASNESPSYKARKKKKTETTEKKIDPQKTG